MKRDFLENLGLDDDVIQKIMDENKREILFDDAVKRAVGKLGVRFSSKAAERDFFGQLKQKNLDWVDGQIVGLEDFVRNKISSEPDSFASIRPAPKFVAPSGLGPAPSGLVPPNVAQARAMGAEKAAALIASKNVIKNFV